MARRWLVAAAFALACAFLLPNHSPPWVSFHGDAWAALMLWIVAAWVFANAAHPSVQATPASPLTWVALALIPVPLLQYAMGMDMLFGSAFIHSSYLAGFFVALRLGEIWYQQGKGQATTYVLLAMLLAAPVSVALQVHQWLGLEPLGIWTMGVASGGRMYANMAQPNMLASLLLLALLGVAWFRQSGRLGLRASLALAVVLLFGIALTESRTAWLNLVVLYAGLVVLRKKLDSPGLLKIATCLMLVFALMAFLLPLLGQSLVWSGGEDLDAESPRYRAVNAQVRLDIWSVSLNASSLHPFTGYGWGRVVAANFATITDHPGYLRYFTSSHNLFLDLILWNGYPLGLLIGVALAWWWWNHLCSISDASQAILFGAVTVLLVHAQLELPLQYAIFLLPFGVLAGSLQAMQAQQSVRRLPAWPKWADLVALACVGLALAVTISDYFKVETSFLGLRFENAGVRTTISREPPQVLVLDQFVEHLKLARNTPRSGLSEKQLADMERVVNTLPSARAVQRVAQNYALNGQPERARYWLRVLCKSLPEPNCGEMHSQWQSDPLYWDIPWPEDTPGI